MKHQKHLAALVYCCLFFISTIAAVSCSSRFSTNSQSGDRGGHNGYSQLTSSVPNPLYKKIGDSGSVLVYFDKEGCPACAAMEPNLQKAVNATGIRLIKLIPDRQTRIDFGLGHFPTYCIYVNGNEYRRWIGIIPAEELIESINQGNHIK